MEVRNLIKSNATVVQITEIGVGDVYKRLVESTYQEPKIVCGCVTEILNNGDASSLVAVEFAPVDYGQNVEATTRVFNGKSEITLFPVAVEDYRKYLSDAIDKQNTVVNKALQDLESKQRILNDMIDQSGKMLKSAVTKEIANG